MSSRLSLGAIALFGCLTTVGLAVPGIGRSYDYDESVTVGLFVRQADPLSAVTDQRIFNNHPALSGLNWIVWHLGGNTETWQRIVPLVAGVACVALVTAWCGRRFGLVPAAAACALVATNPLFVEATRSARGYALAALFTAAATILVHAWWRDERTLGALYAVVVALVLLSHLYVAIPLLGHGVATFVAHRDRFGVWTTATIRGGFLAAPVYLAMAPELAAAAGSRDGSFVPEFPRDVLDAAFGTPLVGLAVVALVGVFLLRDASRDLQAMTGASLALLAVVWLVVQPLDFYPRFLIWAVPIGALAIGAVVHRWPVSAAVVVLAVVAVVPDLGDELDERTEIRTVALEFRQRAEQGLQPCTSGYFAESLVGYLDPWPDDVSSGRCNQVFFRPRDGEVPDGFVVVGAVPDAPSVCIAVRSRGADETGGSCSVPIS